VGLDVGDLIGLDVVGLIVGWDDSFELGTNVGFSVGGAVGF
jgi:hypothetical protein